MNSGGDPGDPSKDERAFTPRRTPPAWVLIAGCFGLIAALLPGSYLLFDHPGLIVGSVIALTLLLIIAERWLVPATAADTAVAARSGAIPTRVEAEAAAMIAALAEASSAADAATQSAAAIISADGDLVALAANGFPPGVVANPDRLRWPVKHDFIEHAERSAIYSAARHGHALEGATIVAPWACCAECARAIVAVGIVRLVRFPSSFEQAPARWHTLAAVGEQIMVEAGVEIVEIDPSGFALPEIRRDGRLWRP